MVRQHVKIDEDTIDKSRADECDEGTGLDSKTRLAAHDMVQQRRKQKNLESNAAKRGRLSNLARQTGVATGVNIDDSIREYFRRGTKLFYENAEKVSRIEAFERILALFFHRGKELRNGVFVPLLPPADRLPTLSQYRYWYRKEPDLARSDASRKGSPASDTGKGAVLGPLRQTIPSPGCQFEIHVVFGDIYLVSMLDRRHILGRPVIYIIVDVFSGFIVGMSVSLEGPSRQGTMLALENMSHDKVAYCREYGVHITEDDWPSHHLPKAILANRSELLLENANILVNALDIEISNTQPCRLDWKESFERCFPLLDDMTINWVPGSVNSLSKPGRKGHRLDGSLTLNEFRRLVIECIIEHNIAHRLSDDDLDGDMIADGVELYPRDVWTWGIQNHTGVLRLLPIDDTIAIAESLGVKHPTHPRTKRLIVMTTDFYISLQDEGDSFEHARTVKYAKDLDDPRTIEKLEIERRFWEARDIDWGIVTEHEIPMALAKNVDFLHDRKYPPSHMSAMDIFPIAELLTSMVVELDQPLCELTTMSDRQLGLPGGTSLGIAYYLLATRQWHINMNVPIDPDQRLAVLGTHLEAVQGEE